MKRYKDKQRKKEFKEEVHKFLSAEKQGLARTYSFQLEELKTYMLSKKSTFSQVLTFQNYI